MDSGQSPYTVQTKKKLTTKYSYKTTPIHKLRNEDEVVIEMRLRLMDECKSSHTRQKLL